MRSPFPTAAALFAMLCLGNAAQALTLPEAPAARVNDYAGALPAGAAGRLEKQIAQATTGRSLQLAVAIFRSLESESLEDVSIRLADRWKIGGKGSDDGVLVLVFLDEHKLRIEVGYGLEGVLPDVRAARIIREVMAPSLRRGDLEAGLRDGITAITAAVAGEPSGPVRTPGGRTLPVSAITAAVTLLMFVLAFVFLAVRRRQSGWSGGAQGWQGELRSGLFWSFILSMFFGGRGGGSGGGFGGGGGGGGGFSGGGGSFGGGGASGSW